MKIKKIIALAIALAFFISPSETYAYSNPAVVPLGTVVNFAALAKTLISSPTGGTVLNNGDLGIDSPGTCTGFPSPCTASGTATINNGAIQYQNAVALQGQTDATAAIANITSRPADEVLVAQLGGQTLTQGVYEVPADVTNLTGDLTLSGDASSIFIFHMTSTLITDSGSRVLLSGGVQPCNVIWKVDSSATLNGTTSFVGTIIASDSITFPGGAATLDGRAIAQTAAITFNNTTVNNSQCASTSTTTSSSSSTSSSIDTSIPYCPPISDQVVEPMILQSRRIDSDSIFFSWGPYSGTDTFNIQYGTTNGDWLYNTDVTGFSTTLNNLPLNQPIWARVAARNYCQIGSYGEPRLVGGPGMPNTGKISHQNNFLSRFLTKVITTISFVFDQK